MRNLRSSSAYMNTLLVPIRLVHAMRSDRDSGGESRPRRCTSACAASRSLSSQSGGRADFAPNPIIKTVNMSAIRLHTTPSHSRTSIARMLRTASDIEAPPLTGVHLCPRPRRRTELYGPGRTVTLRAADSWPCQVIRTFAGDRALISSEGPPTRPRKWGSSRERLPGPPRRGCPVEWDRGRLVLRGLVPT